jgi:hypothetical protein
MRLVTTCHAEGYELYGHRLLESWKHWPVDAELWWYTEGFSLPANKPDGIVEISLEKIPALQAFKSKYANYTPPNYLYDVVRFSNKVFAAIDALADYQGIGVWMDADCVTRQDIPEGFIEGHLGRNYMAMFKRRGMYTETGFWLMDCRHPQHRAFLDMWGDWYESGAFKQLANWTDCETLDATVRKFGELIKTASLSGAFENDMHPMAKVELAKYIDHCKGGRKAAGFSPENKWAQ